MNPQTDDVTVREIEEDQEEEQVSIRLINVIFLPFHPAVRILTLCAVIAKSLLGPFTGTYPGVMCASESEIVPVLYYSLRFYEYFSDAIVGIDLFLHIVHRQVTEEASKKEHAPKSLVAIILDALSLIPFFSFIVRRNCPPTKLWPNILALTESLCFYRVVEYFDLRDTHSFRNIFIGYTIIFLFLTNLVACVVILLTYHGLCSACSENIYDWRLHFKYNMPEMDADYNLYDFAMQMSAMNLFFINVGEFKPATYLEYVFFSLQIILGFFFITFIIGPKIFAEIMLRARKNILFYIRSNRIIEEANKRNLSKDGDNLDLETYFSVIWKKMEGVILPPGILVDIPRYLKLHMKEDIAWAVFHHSPTLRRTSSSYKRWLYDQMSLEYKMPGERLFSGHHCYTHLYYLKAGIVQLLSTDDGTTPVLSVTGGSLFGDISFYLPPLHRRTIVRCLTFCEIIAVPRVKLVSSLHKFPEDRSMILKSVNDRIKHAKILSSCKIGMRGFDRVEDEGLAWLKTRWWTLWTAIQHWKKSSKKDTQKCKLPPEKSSYHCSKYIGQLVLCKKDQLQLSTVFAKVTFPWILSENSSLIIIWHKIVKFIVFMVLILFPPNIAKEQMPDWFIFFSVIVDIVYIADIFFNVITKTDKHRNDVDFKVMMVAKLKSWRFLLDVLSTAWLGQLFTAVGQDMLARVAPLARLLKLHVLFDSKFETWNRKKNLLNSAVINYLLFSFSILYISAYVLFIIISLLGPKVFIDMSFMFGPLVCSKSFDEKCETAVMWVFYYFILHYHFGMPKPVKTYATWLHIVKSCIFYLLDFYGLNEITAAVYLQYRDISKYNVLVTSLKWFYRKSELHPDALKRVERYFLCQWKNNFGMSIIYPIATEGESESTYWAHHGKAAERIIGSSTLFMDSQPSLIRDLAEKSRFSLVPQGFTLILFGVQCNCITWIANGELKCEYKNESGDIVSHYSKPTDILTLSPLFPGLPAFKTYITATDCNILYITKRDFFKVMKKYPEQWLRINTCVEELSPIFDETFRVFLKQHQSYQKKLRERIFHDRKSVFAVTVKQEIDVEETPPTSVPFGTFISSPEAPFVRFWITARMLVVVLSIFSVNVRSFILHNKKLYYEPVGFAILRFCELVGFADTILKLFLPYYDDHGLIVSDYKKCMKRYISQGFLLDVIGCLPWRYLTLWWSKGLASAYAASTEFEIYLKYAHLYIVAGYFNYIVDKPCSYRNHVLFIKWQLITVLVMLGAGNFYFMRCFEYSFDISHHFVSSTVKDTCWNPLLIARNASHTTRSYHFEIAKSVELALNIMLGVYRPEFDPHINGTTISWFVGLLLKLVFWFVCLYSQTLLMLNAQTNTSFQHGVQELVNFLKEERVEKPTIKRCVEHYNYIWLRTKGVNAEKLYDNIGTGNSLSQDINFYIFKSAYAGLNTIFKGGEILERKLSAVVANRRFLPNEDIIREMDIVPFVYIVHRGQVTISRNGRKFTTITVGGLFGQLSGVQPRPVRVTARTESYADVLELSINDFQDIFAQEYKEILDRHRYDFIKLKKEISEVPSLKVESMIRGIRILKFPFIMKKPVDIRSCVWYERFLYFEWMWITSIIIANTALNLLIPHRPVILNYMVISTNFFESLYIFYYLTEFFTMELVIVNNKIKCRYLKWRLLFQWSFIFNTFSLVAPKVTFVFPQSPLLCVMDLPRVLRSHVYYYFHKHFCNNFQNKYSPIILKLVILFQIVQYSTCIWIFVTCRKKSDYALTRYKEFVVKYAPDYVTKSVDLEHWTIGELVPGCLRKTQHFETPSGMETGSIISKYWYGDYVTSFWFMLTVLTQIEIDAIGRLGIGRSLKIFLTLILKWSRLWISAVAITFFFTNFNELYTFERKIEDLKIYFKRNGLSKPLLESMETYAKRLWKRQKGSSLPKFALGAPLCLKQDIFRSLYMHHLRTPTLFQVFPEYFLRQLAVRLTRKVVFPGNYIVQEGDIHPTLYFIHEGEVEKWCTDAKGESKLSCVLTMNGYFGLVPALFPNAHYQFAYYSRTVVDLICLNYNDWQDLLDAYPDVKANLYRSAQRYKHGDKHGKSKLDAPIGS